VDGRLTEELRGVLLKVPSQAQAIFNDTTIVLREHSEIHVRPGRAGGQAAGDKMDS
jgi:hypothetical protein